MVQPVRFAIVGCGVIGPWHARAIKATPGARLVAVCDIDMDKASALARRSGCDACGDYARLLERDDIDAVSLCTPSWLHPDEAIVAAKAGKHVLTEKPMATTLGGADRMIRACRRAGVKLGVVLQRRALPIFAMIKRALDGGQLGRLVLGDVYVKYHRSQGYYDSADWRGTIAYDGGGALMNQGIHLIDLLLWYMGPVATVAGVAKTLVRRIEAEDTAAGVIQFRSGALGIIECATSVFPATIAHRIEIHGEAGSIMVEGESIRHWSVRSHSGREINKVAKFRQRWRAMVPRRSEWWHGHRNVVRDFVRAIREDRDPLIAGEEGRRSLALIHAMYEAERTGQPVGVSDAKRR